MSIDRRFPFNFRWQQLSGSCGPTIVRSPWDAQRKMRVPKQMKQPTTDCFYRAVSMAYSSEELIDDFIVREINKVDDGPMKLTNINKFSQMNQHLNLRINVFFMEGDDVFPIYRGTNVKAEHIVNLLLYKTLRDGEIIHHYAFIPDLAKFTRAKYSSNGKCSYQKCFICENCFCKFSEEVLLFEHEKKCLEKGEQEVHLAEEGETIQFEKIMNKFKKQFVGFLDFESKHNVSTVKCVKCANTSEICYHKTTVEALQSPIAFSLVILDSENEVYYEKNVCGNDCVDRLIDCFVEVSDHLSKLNENPIPLTMTRYDEKLFQESTVCHICETDFFASDLKVRDHCHYTGNYLGSAHVKCNLMRTSQQRIPVFCHNFSGYDSHLILKAMTNDKRIWKMSAIPHNTEKVRTLTINRITMLDSMSFLQGSLAELVNNLASASDSFPILRASNLFKTQAQLDLLLRKGVFPYEFADNIEKLKKTKNIPSKKSFFNTLTDSNIADDEYAHAQHVFQALECKNMFDYMMLYMRLDTYLLADVFMQFRETMFQKFNLDPANYISLPSFSYDCMLKYTEVEIDRIHDYDMYKMLSDNIRGGFSFISSRIETEINYATGERENNIDYLDANNLYGGAQSRSLPISDYYFLTDEEINEITVDGIAKLSEDDETGYIFEVDLEYPDSLHAEHRSYPLAPEKMTVTENMLSDYQKECRQKLSMGNSKVPKLISTFRKRIKYVVHGQNLKLYLRLGMKLTKIHRVLSFTQSKFLKKYIDYCTEQRVLSKTDFSKRLFKLMANSIYGKFIENKSKHMQVMFCTSESYVRKWINSPKFSHCKIINDNLVAVYIKKDSIEITQAYAIGFSILDLSKEFMYRSYYEYIKPRLGKECRVLMSDTDSLFLASKYRSNNLKVIQKILDTSNFDTQHPLYTTKNKSRLGFFKSETGSKKISRFIGLRSKCYAFDLKSTNESHTKCKGVAKAFRKKIPVSSFARCLEEICSYTTTQFTLRSKNHQIQLAKQQKLCFSSYDDKMYLLDCGLHSLPYYSSEICDNVPKCTFCDIP